MIFERIFQRIFARHKKLEIKFRPSIEEDESNCIFVDGQMWTDMSFSTSFDPHGVTVHVSGDVILQSEKNHMPNEEGHFWVPESLFTNGVRDVIAFSRVFINNRYSLKTKKYDRGSKDLCIFKNSVS
jgi:hypothetical protein